MNRHVGKLTPAGLRGRDDRIAGIGLIRFNKPPDPAFDEAGKQRPPMGEPERVFNLTTAPVEGGVWVEVIEHDGCLFFDRIARLPYAC